LWRKSIPASVQTWMEGLDAEEEISTRSCGQALPFPATKLGTPGVL
jgi:hypothetical protein